MTAAAAEHGWRGGRAGRLVSAQRGSAMQLGQLRAAGSLGSNPRSALSSRVPLGRSLPMWISVSSSVTQGSRNDSVRLLGKEGGIDRLGTF